MKRYLYFFLSPHFFWGIILALFSGGCSPSKQPPILNSITLTIWESYNHEEHQVFTELLELFCKRYQEKNGISLHLDISRVSHEGFLPKLKMATLTHTTPDIARVDCAHVITLAYGKAIVALDTLSSFPSSLEEYCAPFVPAAIESNIVSTVDSTGKKNAHLYGIPDQTNCVALFWNKKIFKENATRLKNAGLDPERPPQTWEEFVAYGKILSQPQKKQYAFGMYPYLWWFFPFFNSFGASLLQKDEQGNLYCGLHQEEGRKALAFICDLTQKTYLVDGNQISIEGGAWKSSAIRPEQGFMNEIYAMIFSGPWNLQTFKNAGLDFGVGLIPAGPAGSSSTIGGTNMVVFRSCSQPEVAFQVLQYIHSEDFQYEWNRRLGQLPTIRLSVDQLNFSQFPEMAVFYQQLQTTQKRFPIPRYDLVEQWVNSELALALQGQKTPEAALDSAAKKIEKFLFEK